MTNISRSSHRKLHTLSRVMLVLLLAATGCTKELPSVEDPTESPRYTTDDWEGTTYMSLALRTTAPSTDPSTQQEDGAKEGKESKTGAEDFTTWQGDDIIENFAVYIVSEGIDKVQCVAGSVTDSSLAKWDATKQELLLHPFRTPPVSKRIFAFFNIPEQYQEYLGEKLNNRKEFLERIAEPIPYRGAQGVTYNQDAPVLDAFRPDSHIAKKVVAKDEIPQLLSLKKNGGREASLINPWQALDFPNRFADRVNEIQKQGSITFYKRKDLIMASGERYNYLPEDYITKEEVEQDKRNLVQVYTRRVLAQAVVTTEASLVESPHFSGLQGMKLVGLSFQALNFEPTFYPIAKTTKEGEWPGNSNTMTPLYDKSDNSSRINLSTYKSTYDDETFDAETLTADRYFRSAHFVYDLPSIKELEQDDPDYAQKLMRQREITSDGKIDGTSFTDFAAPKHTTTYWGSCYVTESTQKWGTDASSGYNNANTPFFALVAAFDTESLPWGDNTKTTALAKIKNLDQDFENAVKAWRAELAAKEAELAAIPESSGGGMSEADADAVFEAYKKWCEDNIRKVSPRWFEKISEFRDQFKANSLGEDDYLGKIKSTRQNIRRQNLKSGKKLDPAKVTGKATEFDAPDLDVEQTEFKKSFDADKKLRQGDPNAEQRQKLNNEIAALKKKIADFEKEFKSSGDKYPKLENSTDNKEFYTQFIYEQGITRIFYSQVDQKFYLNYHEIDLANRGGHRHDLTVNNDPWLQELESKLPNGKDFPTEANGAPATAAVLPPTPELMGKLSQLLNRDIKETDLNPAERHSMDFYLYGRIAPGLKEYFFGAGADRTKPVDLQSGYVAWYTANTPDRVVSYPCYIRERKVDEYGREQRASIQKGRLMMVYYAWLNPNTGDPTTSYASPVLRNNIYHMHITGFTKVGLSAIPFVPRQTKDSGYSFLHWKLDPDEVVPTDGAPLVTPAMATGAGQATGLSDAGSSSFRITF